MPENTGDAPEINADLPEVKALIEAAVREATSGLAANKDEILGEKKALQDKLDSLSEQWKGLDPEAVRGIMDRMANDEETKLLAEGKMDVVIERRTERLKADHQKQIAKLEESLAQRETNIGDLTKKVKRLLIEGNLRQAASEQGLVASAVDDALARASSIFQVDENGALIAEEDGTTIYGKDGKSSITPSEWLESMKEKAPHWFPAPNGGGASGGTGRNGSHSLTREQARDTATYQAAKKAAQDAGVPLTISG